MLGLYSLGEDALGSLPSAASAYAITIDAITFTYFGNDAGLVARRHVAVAAGTFVVTGQNAAVRSARKLVFSTGAFTMSAPNTNARADRRVYASPLPRGTNVQFGFAALGQTAFGQGDETDDLTVSASLQSARLAASRRLVASPAAIAIGGQAADLVRFLGLRAGGVSFTLSGNPARLATTRRLTVSAGVFSEVGTVIDLARRRRGLNVRPSGGQKLFVGSGGGAKGLRISA